MVLGKCDTRQIHAGSLAAIKLKADRLFWPSSDGLLDSFACLCQQLGRIGRKIGRDAQRKGVPVLKTSQALEGHLLTDNVDVWPPLLLQHIFKSIMYLTHLGEPATGKIWKFMCAVMNNEG